MPRPIYSVFSIEYDGYARELVSEAAISDPLTNKSIKLDRVIWDTGASACAVNLGIAERLNLIPTASVLQTSRPLR